jgi:hypothetical protein
MGQDKKKARIGVNHLSVSFLVVVNLEPENTNKFQYPSLPVQQKHDQQNFAAPSLPILVLN